MAVEGVIGQAVVDDEKIAVTLEVVGIGDPAGMDRPDGLAVLAGNDLDPVVDGERVEARVALRAEGRDDAAAERLRQPALALITSSLGS